MTDCDYCSDPESFSSESEYLQHLSDQHYDSLSAIEKRKVDSNVHSDSDRNWAPILGVTAVVLIVGAVLWLGFASSNSSPETDGNTEPNLGAGHNHVPISVTVDGQQIDFSQQQYQLADRHIHFEGGGGSTLHLHATSVTVEYALERIPNVGDVDDNSAEFDGKTYSTQNGDTVKFVVNGQEVDPTSTVLQDGQNLKVVLKKSG